MSRLFDVARSVLGRYWHNLRNLGFFSFENLLFSYGLTRSLMRNCEGMQKRIQRKSTYIEEGFPCHRETSLEESYTRTT
jgi:hypothetical protein